MIAFIFAFLLAVIAAALMVARKTYGLVPLSELKRQSRAGDQLAQSLYKVAAYGSAAQLLLWLLIVLCAAGSITMLASVLPNIMLFAYALVMMGYILVWLPLSDVTSFGLRCVMWITPSITWLVSHLFGVFEKPANAVQNRQTAPQHTGLYETEDLVALLTKQRTQEDNRFTEAEVDQLLHTLTFAQKKVAEIMTPRKKVKVVSRDEAIGPILMDELHESGLLFFPVHEPANVENFVGTLHLADVVRAKKGGHVRDVMRTDIFFVNEDFTIEQVLHAFIKTKEHALVVVNNFGEFAGIVTIEEVLKAVLGRTILSDFSQYDDLQAVANYKPEPAKKAVEKTPVHREKPMSKTH
ncbi:MAG TPA: CBS domain-containing protein [Candidatus Saccharimonadales bacterium]|nr:CBS domain-containing protein [Candidatus Saccharimonadales bacterium]